jgi:four helix bundle protein
VAYQHFTEMPVWQTAHKLVLLVYRLSSSFPKDEQYALTSQIGRAVVSVSSNIAEGFGRQHSRDKAQFYYNARGSLYEVEDQLLIARDLGYLTTDNHGQVKELVTTTVFDLNKIIKTLIG